MDVMQALSLAGGLNPYASENNIKILRRVNGDQKTFRFKYSRVEKGENLEQNIILQGGDVVVVSPSWPNWLFPHPHTVPSALRAIEKLLPAETAITPVRPETWTGIALCVVVPSPS